jgi:predicted dithiol-disulfide oxidoreductase (DUF899 family)
MSAKTERKSTFVPIHSERFPGESADYRAARDKLLKAELNLRRDLEKVAAMRRQLPPGGPVPQDYVFEEGPADPDDTESVCTVRMSDLFVRPKASLVVYSFMYGPKMTKACPLCTSMLDSLDGTALHANQRINLVVVAKSPIQRIRAYARERGWRNLRLLSSANNTYNRDYHGEDDTGSQWPALNVFARHGRRIRHSFCTELLFASREPGQDGRHVDVIWPLWNLLDFTPEGRGTDWRPMLEYAS